MDELLVPSNNSNVNSNTMSNGALHNTPKRKRRVSISRKGHAYIETTTSERLSRLQHEVERAKTSLFEIIYQHYRDRLGWYSYTLDPFTEILHCSTSIEKFESDFGEDDGVDSDWVEDLKLKVSQLELLCRASVIYTNLREAEDLVSRGNMVVAASTVTQVNIMLQKLSKSGNATVELEIVKLLNSDYTKKASAVIYSLEYLFNEIYQWTSTENTCELQVRYHIEAGYAGNHYESPVSVSDIYYGLAALDMIQPRLEKLAKDIAKEFAIRLINAPETQLNITNATTLAKKLELILDFVYTKVFYKTDSNGDQDSFGRIFGSIFWNEVWPTLRVDFFEARVPSDHGKIGEYTDGLVPLLGFEERLVEKGFISAKELKAKMILSNLFRVFVGKRRSDLLTMCAGVLCSENNNVVTVGGSEKAGFGLNGKSGGKGVGASSKDGKQLKGGQENSDDFPRCKISTQAQTIVELCHETVHQIGSLEPQLASIQFQMARDILNLYRVIIPCRWEIELLTTSTKPMVLYNDCSYIAHSLSTLRTEAQQKWPEILKEIGTFVDIAQQFRELGQTYFEKFMIRCRLDIENILESVLPNSHLPNIQQTKHNVVDVSSGKIKEGYKNNTTVHKSLDETSCKETIKKVVLYLMHLAKTGKVYLPDRFRIRSLGLLTDVVLETAIRVIKVQPILNSGCVRILQQAFKPLDELKIYFTLDVGPQWTHRLKGNDNTSHGLISEFCPHWDTFEEWMNALDVDADSLPILRERGKIKLCDQDFKLLVEKRQVKKP
ncbi:ribosome biogenesis protein ytm1 [Mycoemilia scoparia]|uniref:Ribosome biogenesis protein ytm1 n=1 Tax=Mycoemilia scoparia TaxID=417184 RepID=A0A9W8A865_9FUNG|nr:ribosome biogenesis protein ytm1 [Mycoemilia scoparia]